MRTQEPPNAPELEAGIIAAIMATPNNIYSCIQLLTEGCFYQNKYRVLWVAIVDLHEKGLIPDSVVLMQYLMDKKLNDLISTVIELQSAHFPYEINGYCEIIYTKYVRRLAIEEAQKIIRSAHDEQTNISETVFNANKTLTEAVSPSISKSSFAHDEIVANLQHISDNLGKYQEVTGVPSGFETFDKRTGGFSSEGDLYTIAARPSMGKTTVALNMAWNAHKKFGYSGAFFSLEMSNKQISRILMARETGISADKIKRNFVTADELDLMYKLLFDKTSESKFVIDDTSNASLMYIQSEATKLKQKYDIKFLFIDYLQLITIPALQTREREVSAICKGLKALSSNLGIPVIALAQLNRSVETRGGSKRPQMSDLRGGGSIEEDSSMVSFIYRPEYYGIMEDEQGRSLEGITEIMTCKNRHGEIGSDYLYMDKAISTFDMFDPSTGERKPLSHYDTRLTEMQTMEELENDNNFFTKIIEENEQKNG